jgi:hypothetical protein
VAEGELPEPQKGEARFTTIETLVLAAGGVVSLEAFEQQLAESGLELPHCPRCGFDGQGGPLPCSPINIVQSHVKKPSQIASR